MSYNLYFWPAKATDDPGGLAEQLADEEADTLSPDARVLAFRAELLHRWPELADAISPWHHDLDWRQPWSGRTDIADRFVGLSLPFTWEHTDALPGLAGAFGLDCYDPQHDLLRLPPTPPARKVASGARPDALDGSPVVHGWVTEENVASLLRHISTSIGYAYDDLDEAALTGALDGTDDRSTDAWFAYPLQGRPPLTVHLALSVGTINVSVHVQGDLDPVLARQIEETIDLL